VEFERYLGKKIEDGRFHIWIRATGRLPDEPAIHQCVLAYTSDMMLLDSALIPHGRTVFEKNIMAASLDHALWFHRPFRADDWLLYAQDSPNLAGARGFSRGLIFARDGTLVASVAQDCCANDGRRAERPLVHSFNPSDRRHEPSCASLFGLSSRHNGDILRTL
jgi:acyl-CoA thioesterase-2